MIIRPAAEADLPAMARLTHGALSFAAPPEPGIWEGADEAIAKRLRPYVAGPQAAALVVEAGDEIVGFVGCRLLPDGGRPGRALVEILAIAPANRGRGIGTRLVQELQGTLLARGVADVEVEVDSANKAATTFWRRAGFSDLRVRMAVSLAPESSPEA